MTSAGFKKWLKKKQARKRKRLEEADDTGWFKHTSHHWYKDIRGVRVNYWPSTGTVRIGETTFRPEEVNCFLTQWEWNRKNS